MKITFLGTDTSHGIPVIDCECAVCWSEDTKNHRTRPSIVITVGDLNILGDTSPELRLQAIRCGIKRVDAILFTHIQADHIFGLDDVRVYSDGQNTVIPCYGSSATLNHICATFDYAFKQQTNSQVSHLSHFTIPEALQVVRELKPRQTYFTHMTHDVGHQSTNDRLPEHVQLAYDSLIVEV